MVWAREKYRQANQEGPIPRLTDVSSSLLGWDTVLKFYCARAPAVKTLAVISLAKVLDRVAAGKVSQAS
jgi:hypothetical protein